MSLEPENKVTNVRYSLKKFFVDNIEIKRGINVYFDRSLTPKSPDKDIDRWMLFALGGIVPAVVSEMPITIHVLSRRDIEGDDIAEMLDILLEELHPGFIPFYDADTKVQIGGFKVFLDPMEGFSYTWDDTKIQNMFITIKWGAIW